MPREAGHTLLELLVATTVSTLIVVLAMEAWRPMGSSALGLRDRARADTELRLAADALLQDLGGAQTALPGPDGELQIVRVPALAQRLGAFSGGDDDGIVWSFADGRLSRWDHELSGDFVLADGLTAFTVTRDGDETHVLLGAGSGADARQLELVWPQ